jgi:hypothetical protein
MRIYTAPELPQIGRNDKTIFLGGSIEMGTAERWQEEVIDKLNLGNDWVILNPRRKDWDPTWKQSIDNPFFYQQVDWEMTYLNRATYKIFYFADNTLSPITLLELGKYGQWDSFVVCKENYLRRGNVEIFCHHNNIPIYKNIDEVIKELINISKE